MALSGPMANFITAFLAGMLIRFLPLQIEIYKLTLLYLLFMNIGLGLFNLIPIPPLDGSHVLENLLPPHAEQQYRQFARYGPMVLIGIIMLDNFARTGILSRILIGPMKYIAHLFSGLPF